MSCLCLDQRSEIYPSAPPERSADFTRIFRANMSEIQKSLVIFSEKLFRKWALLVHLKWFVVPCHVISRKGLLEGAHPGQTSSRRRTPAHTERFPSCSFSCRRGRPRPVVDLFHRRWQRYLNRCKLKKHGGTCCFSRTFSFRAC